jgi:hypothetical protein
MRAVESLQLDPMVTVCLESWAGPTAEDTSGVCTIESTLQNAEHCLSVDAETFYSFETCGCDSKSNLLTANLVVPLCKCTRSQALRQFIVIKIGPTIART